MIPIVKVESVWCLYGILKSKKAILGKLLKLFLCMNLKNESTLSHVYGVAGLVPGLIGLVYLVKTDAPWQEYALLASGWITAIFYALMLFYCFSRTREDGELIGELSERNKSLEKELNNRNALLDYLSGLLMGRTGIPRAAQTVSIEGDE